MSTELGKKYPCFGEFKCPRCHKKWQSSKAWADYGQKCKSCSINVKPSELQKLFVYICSNCNAKWNWSYESQGQKCKRCSSAVLVRPLDRENFQDRQFIKAHTLRSLSDVDYENHIDPNKEHRQDLCEKCQILKRPCREIAGQNYAAISNTTSLLNTENKPGFITDNQNKQRTLPTYNSNLFSSSYDETVHQRSMTNRSSISNNISTSSIRYSSASHSTSNSPRRYEEYSPTPSSNPTSDSWCIIL